MKKMVVAFSGLIAIMSLGACAYDPYESGPPPAYQSYTPPPPRYPQTELVDAPVVSVTPVYQTVQVATPQQQCWQGPADNSGNHIFGTLAGGALGGLVGNQFGRGGGNAAMTALGAVGGAVAGNSVANQYDQGSATHCRTIDAYSTDQRPAGYDVAYNYNGRIYHTHSDYAPGRSIRVQVDVTPR